MTMIALFCVAEVNLMSNNRIIWMVNISEKKGIFSYIFLCFVNLVKSLWSTSDERSKVMVNTSF